MKHGNKHLLAVGYHFFINGEKYWVSSFGFNTRTKESFWCVQTPNGDIQKREKNYMDEVIRKHKDENSHL